MGEGKKNPFFSHRLSDYLFFFQYGFAQIQPLPYDSFKWVDEKDFGEVLKRTTAAGPTGYIFEVDLEYPSYLHDDHSQFPFAPETMNIEESMLSPYSKSKLCVSGYKSKKLVASFHSRKNYVIHFAALLQCLSLGLKLTKVHRALQFRQFDFLKPYIEHTAFLRSTLSSSFEKKCMKLMANSLYGKTIEDPRRYTKLSFCSNSKSVERCVSSPFYKCVKIYSPNFAVCFLQRESIDLNQCHAVGLSILDYSKMHMYDLFYNRIRSLLHLGSNEVGVVMSDTDSFLLALKTNDSLIDIYRKLSPVMDFSNYPPHHPLFSLERKGQLGLLKDEMKGEEIDEACAIRSKCYSFLSGSGETHSRCKGCPSRQTKQLSFDDYKNVVLNLSPSAHVSFCKISSKDHKIITQQQTKKIFSPFDDKRFYTCSIHSVPYGHYYYAGEGNETRECIYC